MSQGRNLPSHLYLHTFATQINLSRISPLIYTSLQSEPFDGIVNEADQLWWETAVFEQHLMSYVIWFLNLSFLVGSIAVKPLCYEP